ncbi:Pimeloyl-ACP methyl ester carboxylesterase [Geotoga petraea]|uniref:Pimeloyl-ACP methyl ester carboxylesterase n=2 Tax=Geotoga petraea TaxID=28234 RepID=A0A1G6HN62_9BACT|nr:alpha/beta hydrolase [Geotoga petraea]SDB95325.1 Pimeloyl-ACP methyl ester carboxylesterase [Geotoga petraea]
MQTKTLMLILLFTIPFLYNYEDGVYSHRELAYSDSKFMRIDGFDVHYKEYGEQNEKTIILLHGFGSHTYTWDKVIKQLGEKYHVIAFDRSSFGLTERVFDIEENIYSTDYQIDLIKKIMNKKNIEKAILIGNSAGGTISLNFYFRYPELVERLILVDAAVYVGGGFPDFVKLLLFLPQVNYLGPEITSILLNNNSDEFIKSAFYDDLKVTDEVLAEYKRPTLVKGYKKAFWEFIKGTQNYEIIEKLDEIEVPTLVITGDNDVIVPTEQSIKLSKDIKNSKLVILENTGHLPQEENPVEFIQVVEKFLKTEQ